MSRGCQMIPPDPGPYSVRYGSIQTAAFRWFAGLCRERPGWRSVLPPVHGRRRRSGPTAAGGGQWRAGLMLTGVDKRKIGVVRRRQGSTTWSNPARSKPNKTNSPLCPMWCLAQGAAISERSTGTHWDSRIGCYFIKHWGEQFCIEAGATQVRRSRNPLSPQVPLISTRWSIDWRTSFR